MHELRGLHAGGALRQHLPEGVPRFGAGFVAAVVEVVGQGDFAGEDVAPLYHGTRLRGFGMDVDAGGEALLCLAVFPNQGDVGVGAVA